MPNSATPTSPADPSPGTACAAVAQRSAASLYRYQLAARYRLRNRWRSPAERRGSGCDDAWARYPSRDAS